MNDDDTVFVPFPKIPRLNRDVVVTEKIDGTNGQLYITDDGELYISSRNRVITPGKSNDNYGFAAWAYQHSDALKAHLGPGRHYGEWWGVGIARGYDLRERRFSLFNTSRWAELPEELRAVGVDVVPVLCSGPLANAVKFGMHRLENHGSLAAPGYDKPEGVVVFHRAANQLFKVTLENDELPKALADKEAA